MSGETNLRKLIRNMRPELHPGEYVFCTINSGDVPAGLNPLGTFHEQEGLTVILPREQADQGELSYSFVAGWITLNVHSALEAVGLTAAVSQALTRAGISCNVVAAYYHDHIFVPTNDARLALEVLERFTHSPDRVRGQTDYKEDMGSIGGRHGGK